MTRTLTLPSEAHVVMLAQYLPLHFVSTMHRLASRVGRLTLLLSEPMDMSRDWRPEFTGLNVIVQKSLRFPIRHHHPLGFEENGRLLVPYSTIPDLLRLRPDVVIAVEVGPRTLQAALLKSLGADFKLIVQVRESETTAQARGWLRRSLRRILLPRADRIFVNGESGRRHVLECGAARANITVVPSGTDTALFGKVEPTQPKSGPLRLLYVGQLIPRKGIVPFVKRLAAEATKSSREIALTLVGRGFQEEEVRAIPCPANLTLYFTGSRPYAELPAVYAEMDALVMPSLADEWGLVVNEAMASGLPVLGSSGAQAVEEMVANNVSGWVYDAADEAQLSQKLQALFHASPSELLAMGQAARRAALHFSDDYAAETIFSGVRQVLQPLLPPGSSQRPSQPHAGI